MKNRYHILSESPKVSDQELEEYMDFEALLENRKASTKPGKSKALRYWAIGISFFLILSIGAAGWFWSSNESAPLNTNADDIESTSDILPEDNNMNLGLGIKKEDIEPIKKESHQVVQTQPKPLKKAAPDPESKKAAPEPSKIKSAKTAVPTQTEEIEQPEPESVEAPKSVSGSGLTIEIEDIKQSRVESYETFVQTPSKDLKKKTKTPPLKESSKPQATAEDNIADTVQEIQSTVKKEEYSFIDAKPQGGTKALYQYIAENLVYPKGVKDRTIEGEVLVSFTITREGQVADIKINKSLGALFDEEVIRVIKGMPDWIPATLNGNNVESKLSIPLYFNLDDEGKEK